MLTIHRIDGHPGGECFLLAAPESAVLFDAGFDFCAEKTADIVQGILGTRSLDYILASHTHYDHISGAPTLKRRYPNLRVAGSHHAKKVVSMESAREQMRLLNASYARDNGITRHGDLIDELRVDTPLADGEELRLPGLTIRAVATPGHTRCAMSYHFPEHSLLACSETVGIAPGYPDVTPCMIVGYQCTLDSIERSRRIGAGRILLSHTGLTPDGEAGLFFDNARRAVENATDLLVSMHDRGCDENEIVDAFAKRYHASSADIQPERAFELNTRALIPRILRELGKTA